MDLGKALECPWTVMSNANTWEGDMVVYEIKQHESGDYHLWEIELTNSPCGDRHWLVFTSGSLAAVEQRKMELEWRHGNA